MNNKLYHALLRSFPNFLWPLKRLILKFSLNKVGKNVKIGSNVLIHNPHLVSMGDYVFIGNDSSIVGIVEITIGNYVMFGPEVMIRGGDHNIKKVGLPMRFVKDGGVNLPIKIEDDVWIGARTTILKGVTVGEGAVIGASSLVNKDILPYTVNVGIPSRPVKVRFNYSELEKHLKLVHSRYSIKEIEKIYMLNGISFNE